MRPNLYAAAVLAAASMAAPVHADTISIDGAARTYALHVPAAVAAARKPVPLVLVLHGGGGDGPRMRAWAGFDPVADRNGIIVAYPDALDKTWNDGRAAFVEKKYAGAPPDDVAFLTGLVADLVKRGLADPARVYVSGASNGGMMTFRLACETSGVFAAFGTVVANLSTDLAKTCQPKAGVRLMMINGTADTFVPYGGGAVIMKRGTVIPAEETFAFWSKRNGCTQPSAARKLPDLDPKDGSEVEVTNCPEGRTVFYRVIGGGHQWPSITRPRQMVVDRVLGPLNRDFEAADHLWQFFARP